MIVKGQLSVAQILYGTNITSGAPAFYLTRFLLGSCESGFIPASLYTISRFYKRDETSKRFSWFFIGNHFASAVSGFIAYVSHKHCLVLRTQGSSSASKAFVLEMLTCIIHRASYNYAASLDWVGGSGYSL